MYLYFKIGSVCLCHGQHAIGDRRYLLAPYDKRKHTGHAQQQAASHASTDSAWRHPVWLPHSSLGFQPPVGRRSYHDKPCLTGEVCVTPQATIARLWLVNCNRYSTVRRMMCLPQLLHSKSQTANYSTDAEHLYSMCFKYSVFLNILIKVHRVSKKKQPPQFLFE